MAARQALISPAEYLERERAAEVRHEYVAGSIYAMAGAGRNHALITRNLSGMLFQATGSESCLNLDQDVKVWIQSANSFYYPDATVSCPPRFIDEGNGIIDNPTVVFEVLSPSTQNIDRGPKFANYRTLESLRSYVLIESELAVVEVNSLEDGEWLVRRVSGAGAIADIPSVGISLKLADLYRHTNLA